MIAIALRNCLRQSRRNLLLVCALAVGVAGAIFADAYISGMRNSILGEARLNLPGTVQVVAAGYLDEPGLANAFAMAPAERERIAAGAPFVARLTVPAIVQSERTTRGVQLVGIEASRELPLTFVGRVAVDGQLPADASTAGVVIGAELAARLKTRLGQRVVVMLRDGNDRLIERGMRIIGVYAAPSEGLESHVMLIGLERLQSILRSPDLLTDIALFDADPAALAARLPAQLTAVSWREIQPMLGALTDMLGGVGWLLRGIIFTALAFGIVNTLLASVYERTREFGLLLALGMPPRHIFSQVAVEVVAIVACALLLGLLAGRLGLLLTGGAIDLSEFAGLGVPGMSNAIALQFSWADFGSLAVFVLALALVASLYPVRRAMQLDPVAAMRHI